MHQNKRRLVFFVSLFLISSLGPVFGDSDYKYIDKLGNEVHLPLEKPLYTQKNPKEFGKVAHFHVAEVKTRVRRSGLEMIRIVTLTVPHPMNDKSNRIQKIYVADKDGLVVGYHLFEPSEESASTELRMNGIINYLQIFVECSNHGVWYQEDRI
jgi:desulfoferrodoxin (superoxide reductase-like protein)